jgi:transposase
LEAEKKRLQRDTVREATSGEIGDLKKENDQLKQLVALAIIEEPCAKKSLSGLESGSEEQ